MRAAARYRKLVIRDAPVDLNWMALCVHGPRAELRSLLLLLLAESMLHHVAAIGTAAGAASSTNLNYPLTPEEDAPEVFYWPLKNATSANGATLSYEERAVALAFQGIVNSAEDLEGHRRRQQAPSLFFDAVSAGWLNTNGQLSMPHWVSAAALVPPSSAARHAHRFGA